MNSFSVFNKSTLNSNLFLVCIRLLKKCGVKFNTKNLKDLLNNHLDYHSLLAVKDTLNEYGIKSVGIRKGDYSYSDIETPFICSIQRGDWNEPYFTVVTFTDDKNITYLDPITNNDITILLTEFNAIDKDIILLIDESNAHDEPNYFSTRKSEKKRLLLNYTRVSLFIIAWLFILINNFLNYNFPINFIGGAYFLLTTIGVAISLLLVWSEIDIHNPFLKEVCGRNNKKRNCSSVLLSKGSKIFGISWSVVGLTYFTTLVLVQLLFHPYSIPYLNICLIASFLILPYIFYSIYYQFKIIKQWCPLCLAIQLIIALSATLSLIYFYRYPNFNYQLYPLINIILICGLVSGLVVSFSSLLRSTKEGIAFKKKFEKLHYNPDIFNQLLLKEPSALSGTDKLGILVGNTDANIEIIKVCNPYCGPCSQAHLELDNLIRSNLNLKLRIIFTATGEDSDMKTAPVQHFLALDQQKGKEAVIEALHSWYMSESKDYDVFSKKFPIEFKHKDEKNNIENMRRWCDLMKIRSTPTFFVNGHELPDSYRISELKHIYKLTK